MIKKQKKNKVGSKKKKFRKINHYIIIDIAKIYMQ